MAPSSALLFLLLFTLPLTGGCASSRHEVCAATCRSASHSVLFTADGAGSFRATSHALSQAVQQERLPVTVETFDWSHGYARVFSDQLDHRHIREAGGQLAEQVLAFRGAYPEDTVCLLGHSAGAAVVLAAAECLPPQSVDLIVLLAPSVAAEHDLRAALRCSRRGIDVFYSSRDWWYLGVGTALLGTADGSRRPAAGRVGFCPIVSVPQDATLYAKLRQHPWHPCLAWTGHRGGHYGAYQIEYLRRYVLPLLTTESSPTGDGMP